MRNNQITKYVLTDKFFSEALILASTNPQYDNRLFMELPVQYMKTTSAELVIQWKIFCHIVWLVDARSSASEKDLLVQS